MVFCISSRMRLLPCLMRVLGSLARRCPARLTSPAWLLEEEEMCWGLDDGSRGGAGGAEDLLIAIGT